MPWTLRPAWCGVSGGLLPLLLLLLLLLLEGATEAEWPAPPEEGA